MRSHVSMTVLCALSHTTVLTSSAVSAATRPGAGRRADPPPTPGPAAWRSGGGPAGRALWVAEAVALPARWVWA